MPFTEAKVVFRGTTWLILKSFFNYNGDSITPSSAQVSISFQSPNGPAQAIIALSPPGTIDKTQWAAYWDSRGALPGKVYYSISATFTGFNQVCDGYFQLNANPANIATF